MNTVGVRTLFLKEVRRFLRVPGQTVFSPLISTTLYFVVFGYSMGSRVHEIQGVPYLAFIVPGLVFLGIANNAFLNTSSSLFINKIQGTIVDLLVAPLGPGELLAGFIAGGMVRGLTVGLLTWGISALFAPVGVAHPAAALGFLVLSAYVFAVLGFLAALWAEKFEQINFFPTFVMLPLTFLGGVFYSVDELPQFWRAVSLFNPMVYMAEGLRYALLDRTSFSPWWGTGMLAALSGLSTAVAFVAVKSGYKLKQ
ncbi:MAG TPA: ABC transporter permease [Myxococcaceae bacterium]|nr:ABC transporter permease [Myxococcaceae bacterium]